MAITDGERPLDQLYCPLTFQLLHLERRQSLRSIPESDICSAPSKSKPKTDRLWCIPQYMCVKTIN